MNPITHSFFRSETRKIAASSFWWRASQLAWKLITFKLSYVFPELFFKHGCHHNSSDRTMLLFYLKVRTLFFYSWNCPGHQLNSLIGKWLKFQFYLCMNDQMSFISTRLRKHATLLPALCCHTGFYSGSHLISTSYFTLWRCSKASWQVFLTFSLLPILQLSSNNQILRSDDTHKVN